MLSYWEQQHFVNYDYLIVGAGIVGLSTALSLREKHPQASILILESGILPTGASTKNAGFACFGSLSELLVDVETMGATEAFQLVKDRWQGLQLLRKRVGDQNLRYQHHGGYELLSTEELPLLEQLDELNSLLQPLFKKPVFTEHSELITQFGFAKEQVATLISNPFEGQVDAGAMMKQLWTLARSNDIILLTGAEVQDFEITNQGVSVRVKSSLSTDIYFRTQRLGLCTNAFTKKLLPNVELDPGRGVVIITKPLTHLKFKGVFHYKEGYYYFRNVGDRVLFGGGRNLDFEGERTTEFDINQAIVDHLLQQLTEVILPGTNFEIETTWPGIMAFGADKRPLLGLHSEQVGYAVRLGGMGVALGSLLGDQLAALLYLNR